MMRQLVALSILAGLATLANTQAGEPCTIRAKRGLAFAKGADNSVNHGRPGAEYTNLFAGYSNIAWMYDWEGVIDGPAADLEYVPMLHDDQKIFTTGWADAVNSAQQKHRTRYILSFNEPDQCGGGGACMDTTRASVAHRTYLQPLARLGLKIGSPAVTSSTDPGKGIDWLKNFMSRCSDCQIDFIVVHWYAWNRPEDFKKYMQAVHEAFSMPVWITEFGVYEGDADEFLRDVLPWMDQQTWIERYAYYMVAPTTGTPQFLVNAAGSALSSTGIIYATL